MQVLIGEFNGKSSFLPELQKHGWGRMWASYGPAWSYNEEPWGFDNGAWSARGTGTFPEAKFLKRIDKARHRSSYPPIVASIPDMVGEGMATLAMAERWIPRLPQDWPWYFVVQDGVCPERTRRILHLCSGLFLGGTDAFKKTAPFWCEMAHRHEKKFHFARCRGKWVDLALEIGADSMDSTRPLRAFTGGEMGAYRRFVQQVTGKCPQKKLFPLRDG